MTSASIAVTIRPTRLSKYGVVSVSEERPLRVEAYAGSRYPERPLRVEWQEQMREVLKIHREWREPDRNYFVLTIEGDIHLRICYHSRQDFWSGQVG